MGLFHLPSGFGLHGAVNHNWRSGNPERSPCWENCRPLTFWELDCVKTNSQCVCTEGREGHIKQTTFVFWFVIAVRSEPTFNLIVPGCGSAAFHDAASTDSRAKPRLESYTHWAWRSNNHLLFEQLCCDTPGSAKANGHYYDYCFFPFQRRFVSDDTRDSA